MTFEEPVHAVVVGIDASVARTAVTSWRGYRMRGYAERMEIDCVIVDCVDPARLAEFWGEVLGRRVDRSVGPYVFLERRRGLALDSSGWTAPRPGRTGCIWISRRRIPWPRRAGSRLSADGGSKGSRRAVSWSWQTRRGTNSASFLRVHWKWTGRGG
jgi:hypothetical protein